MLTENERQFLDLFYRKYGRTLFVYSFSLLRPLPDAAQAAEECVQETFERAMRKIQTLMRHDAPLAWLKNTCRKVTISKRRKILNRHRITGKTVPVDTTHDAPDPEDCIGAWILRNDLHGAKQRLLEILTAEEMDIYRAYYEENLSVRDAAEALQISESAFRGGLQRIRGKLVRISPEFTDSP